MREDYEDAELGQVRESDYEVERPEVCMYCETVPPQDEDIFCGPCRAKVAAGLDKITDPVELVLSAHWASVWHTTLSDDEEKTVCRCGQTFVGGPAYHRRHVAIWIYRALGLKGPSPWELGPESSARHHPDAGALGLVEEKCALCGNVHDPDCPVRESR